MLAKTVSELIRLSLPPAKWYRAAFLFTKYYAMVSPAPEGSYIRERYSNSRRMNHALKLEAILHILNSDTKRRAIFPIPVKAKGEELEYLQKDSSKGLLICTVHTPLNLTGIRYILERGITPDGIVARYPPEDGHFVITGTSVRIPAIPTDRNVLLKVKSILQQGGTVVTSVDNILDGSFSPNQFRLAVKLNADIVLAFTELLPDGTIRDTVVETPAFDSIEENTLNMKIKFMNEQVLTFLNQL